MQNQNIAITYDYYTLDQARQIIAEENRKRAAERAERKLQKKSKIVFYIKQKLSGLAITSAGIIAPFLSEGDITISLIFLPLGIWLIFTKEKAMIF